MDTQTQQDMRSFSSLHPLASPVMCNSSSLDSTRYLIQPHSPSDNQTSHQQHQINQLGESLGNQGTPTCIQHKPPILRPTASITSGIGVTAISANGLDPMPLEPLFRPRNPGLRRGTTQSV